MSSASIQRMMAWVAITPSSSAWDSGRSSETVAVELFDLLGQLDDVLARVVRLGEGNVTAEGLLVAHPDAVRQMAHLGASIVVVVLALDVPAGSAQDPADAVAERGVAAGTDVHRSGRIGAHELDLDALPVAQVDRPEAPVGCQHRRRPAGAPSRRRG